MFAYIHEGKFVRAFDALPVSWGDKVNLDLADKATRESVGLYEVIDQREPLPDGYTYAKQTYLIENGVVYLRAIQNPPSPPSKQELDEAAVRQYTKLQNLKSMTPDQVKTWITANVNTLAEAKDVITTLAIAVSLLARRL